MMHGIEWSIIQFAHTCVNYLPLVTKTTNEQLYRTTKDL